MRSTRPGERYCAGSFAALAWKHFSKRCLPCVVGMEACASAHHWARRIAALGHEVRLIAPAKVKPYVQRGKKNDANDAAAIVEALMRPHMVFVPIKNEAQQAVLMLPPDTRSAGAPADHA